MIRRDGKYYEVSDPYSKISARPKIWGNSSFINRSYFVKPNYYEDEKVHLFHNDENLIIYEMHVRGFTMEDESIPFNHRGTFQGIIDKINYLVDLGITAVFIIYFRLNYYPYMILMRMKIMQN